MNWTKENLKMAMCLSALLSLAMNMHLPSLKLADTVQQAIYKN